MQTLEKITSRRGRHLPVGRVVFFAFFFLYIWLRIRPELIYHGFGIFLDAPIFRLGWQFFKNHLSYTDGVLEYASGFLSQCYYFPWLGALILTAIAWGLTRCIAALLAVANTNRYRLIYYIPAILLLAACNYYDHPLSTCLELLTSLVFFITYELIEPHSNPVRVALFTIMLLVLYHIAAGASLLFVVLVVIHEFFTTRRSVIGLLYLLIGLAVPWLIGTRLAGMRPAQAYLNVLPFNPGYPAKSRYIIGGLWLFPPVIMLLIGLWRNFIPAKAGAESGLFRLDKIFRKQEAKDSPEPARSKFNLQSWVLLIIAAAICLITFDDNRKTILQMNYFSRHKMWPQLLQMAERIKTLSPYIIHDTNRALYHTGRLGEKMFCYPQMPEALLLSPGPRAKKLQQDTSDKLLQLTEICIELGDLNNAEHLACELLEQSGPWPVFLEKLALINMVKGDIKAAQVPLKELCKDLIYARKAKKILARLDSDPQFKSNAEIQHLRSIMCASNHPVLYSNSAWMLQELLKTNRHNRMTFEYLMAHYLLTGQLEKFIENLPRLDDFGYKSIPRHYQEAILLYIGTTRKDVDLGDREINAQTVEQYNEINKIGKKFGHDKKIVWRALAPRFGRSYFFYFTFGVSGVVK